MEDKIIILQRFLKDLQPHPASKKWASGEGSSSGSTFGSSSSHSPQHRRAWQIFVNNKSPTLKHEKRISLEIVCHDKYSYSSPENFIQCVVNISKGNRALPKFSVREKSLSGHLDQSLVFLLLRCRNSEKWNNFMLDHKSQVQKQTWVGQSRWQHRRKVLSARWPSAGNEDMLRPKGFSMSPWVEMVSWVVKFGFKVKVFYPKCQLIYMNPYMRW